MDSDCISGRLRLVSRYNFTTPVALTLFIASTVAVTPTPQQTFVMDPEEFRQIPSIYCHLMFLKTPYPNTDADHVYCNSTWDHISCWPTSPAGRWASIPCPAEVGGIRYDTSDNATKYCFPNGTWHEFSNYSNCKEIIEVILTKEQSLHNKITNVIRHVGCACSVVALLIALFIFTYFRSLRCLRNKIHCHLIISFILRNVLWLILDKVVTKVHGDQEKEWVCKLFVLMYNYFQVTNFFWMFVEGLFLHTMICWAYSADKIRIWYYNVIGWGIPVAVCSSWAIVKWQYEDTDCWLPQFDTYYDYVYIAPTLAALFVNLVFLGTILWVLVMKLQASNTLQTKQYRKAVKALMVLIPLLGMTYVLLIVPYGDKVSKTISVYCNAIVSSTQGLAVAVFYCFLNGEVRHAIKTRFNRWRDHRNMAASKCTMITYSPQSTRRSQTVVLPKFKTDTLNSMKINTWSQDIGGESQNSTKDNMASTPMLAFEKVT